MLKEQPTRARDTRWFLDEDLELFIWSEGGKITGYQLCYDRLRVERCITLRSDGSIEFQAVDGGEDVPTHNRTPVLNAVAAPPPRKLLEEFRRRGEELPRDIVEDVIRRLSAVVA